MEQLGPKQRGCEWDPLALVSPQPHPCTSRQPCTWFLCPTVQPPPLSTLPCPVPPNTSAWSQSFLSAYRSLPSPPWGHTPTGKEPAALTEGSLLRSCSSFLDVRVEKAEDTVLVIINNSSCLSATYTVPGSVLNPLCVFILA